MDIAASVIAWLACGAALGVSIGVGGRTPAHPGTRWLLSCVGAIAAAGVGDAFAPWAGATALALADGVASAALLCIGPLLWRYASAVTQVPDAQPGREHRLASAVLHFLPALALLTIAVVPAAGADADGVARRADGAADRLALAAVGLHLLLYLTAVLWRVHTTRRTLREQWSSIETRDLRWLARATAALMALVGLWWCAAWLQWPAGDLVASLLALAALCVLGAHAGRQRAALGSWRSLATPPDRADADEPGARPAVAGPDDGVGPASDADSTPRYAKAPLPAGLAALLDARLEALMASERPYLDPELTLADLAQALQVRPHQLSQYLGRHRGETFFDHVNARRVAAVIAEFGRPRAATRSMLEIALECGFGSKSAFNAAFRRHAGTTPSACRRRLNATAPKGADAASPAADTA